MSDDLAGALEALRKERVARKQADRRAHAAQAPMKQLRAFAVNMVDRLDELLQDIENQAQEGDNNE